MRTKINPKIFFQNIDQIIIRASLVNCFQVLLREQMLILTKTSLKDSRVRHWEKNCLSHININSVRNVTISEAKFDSSFPTAQFKLPGFRTPYRKDITARSGE